MKNESYRSGRFKRLHYSYPQVWNTLTDPLVVERMKTLSRHGLPAVLSLDFDTKPLWELLDIARNRGEYDQVKRMIGHQVRQVMESIGFRKTDGVKPIRSSWIFASGAVYQKPEWRRVHVYRNQDTHATDLFCLATKRSLAALSSPPKYPAFWKYYRLCRTRTELNFVLFANIDDDFGWNWTDLCDTVARDGYVILGD